MKDKNIILDNATIYILRMVCDYTISQCEEATKKDPLKDNDYIINACKKFLEATEESEK